jgi:threonine/homoserine/homoserine lactone efflux protein
MTQYLILGVVLGLSAGFAPGPLLALVVSETLQHGRRAGVRVAMAPIFTDLFIVVLALRVLSALSSFHAVLGAISIAGSIFVLFLGFGALRCHGFSVELSKEKPRSLAKGILVNSFSPHPYLFWMTVGAPNVYRALEFGLAPPLCFVLSFYALLVGSKVLVAGLVCRSRDFLSGRAYLNLMRFLGLLLVGLALLLFYDGLHFFLQN